MKRTVIVLLMLVLLGACADSKKNVRFTPDEVPPFPYSPERTEANRVVDSPAWQLYWAQWRVAYSERQLWHRHMSAQAYERYGPKAMTWLEMFVVALAGGASEYAALASADAVLVIR